MVWKNPSIMDDCSRGDIFYTAWAHMYNEELFTCENEESTRSSDARPTKYVFTLLCALLRVYEE